MSIVEQASHAAWQRLVEQFPEIDDLSPERRRLSKEMYLRGFENGGDWVMGTLKRDEPTESPAA